MNLAEDPRAAGDIRRYHSWAVHHDQTVGLHTWQILRILLTVWPSCPRNVIVHGVIHDMGEMAGDIQYPFKNLFPELRAGSEKAENYVRDMQRKKMGAPNVLHPLSAFEHHVFKVCDNLEMWEFGLREANMGNAYAKIVSTRMMSAVAGNLASLEAMKETQQYKHNEDVISNIHRYIHKRIEMENFNGPK